MAARASIKLENTQANARDQHQEPNHDPSIEGQIRKLAYDIYRQRDSQNGPEIDDGLQAGDRNASDSKTYLEMG
jgi:hypothetical protein